MVKLHFTIHIDAPKKKVWETMLNDATYRKWTEAFGPGSYFKGSWEKGAGIKFVGIDPEGGGESGMVARIKENRPYDFMSIAHIGYIMNGVEDTTSEAIKKWAPAYENYTFTEENGGTLLTIDLDAQDEFADMFKDMWPKALVNLKKLSEE